jgi:HIP---CoA ligase
MADDDLPTTIPALLDRAEREYADLDAVDVDGESWTFPELVARVREASRALMASGIQRGDRVAIWAPNIREWIVVGLAVHVAGAVLVPVNTRFRGREAAYVLGRSRARMLFTVTDFLGTDYVDLLAGTDPVPTLEEVVVLTGPGSGAATAFADFLARSGAVTDDAQRARAAEVRPGDLCHVLFTSGTTGAPKGAMLAHAAVIRAYDHWTVVTGIRRGDRCLIVLPFFHSFGLNAGIIACCIKGATILPLLVLDTDDLARRIERDRVSFLPGAPTMFQAVLQHPDRPSLDLSSLRLCNIGAAAIPFELVHELRDELGVDVVTGYGITESSGIVSMTRFDDPLEIVAETAGRPLPGLEVRVVDDDGHEVPRGEQGEILVRGYTLMRGYLDDPEQTAATIDADGWLHTGDIGLMRADDNVVITDRLKDMFIVGGFNAYPAEIENLMSEHPAVGSVAVIGVPDERLGEVGMAFVVPRPGHAIEPDALVAWCREQMANYKAPRHVEVVDALPLNASGKVLKYELRAQVAARTS